METTTFLQIGSYRVSPYQPVLWLAMALRHLFDRMIKKREERRAVEDLSTMSDYLLRDIGIGRSEILRTVHHGRPATDF